MTQSPRSFHELQLVISLSLQPRCPNWGSLQAISHSGRKVGSKFQTFCWMNLVARLYFYDPAGSINGVGKKWKKTTLRVMREILRSLSVTRPGLVSDKVCTPWYVLHWSLHGRFMWEFYERGGLLTSRLPLSTTWEFGWWVLFWRAVERSLDRMIVRANIGLDS